MRYLVRKKITKNGIAHLWNGIDTVCRMYSTNGLDQAKYIVVESTDSPICSMCRNANAHSYDSLKAAARSIAYRNKVDIDIAMKWARQGIADGTIVIAKHQIHSGS